MGKKSKKQKARPASTRPTPVSPTTESPPSSAAATVQNEEETSPSPFWKTDEERQRAKILQNVRDLPQIPLQTFILRQVHEPGDIYPHGLLGIIDMTQKFRKETLLSVTLGLGSCCE